MSGDFAISIDHSDIERMLEPLKDMKTQMPKVLMRSINRSLRGMGTDASREIAGGKGGRRRYTKITQKEVKSELNLNDKATLSNLSASMTSRGRPIAAIRFKHRKNTRPGIKGGRSAFVQVKQSSSGGSLDGNSSDSKAFIATMKNGRVGIYRRTGEYSNSETRKHASQINNISRYSRRDSTKKGRELIERVHSPGVSQMLGNPEVRKQIQNGASSRFIKSLEHEVSHILNQEKVNGVGL